jgi:predicted secreted protein
VQTAKVGSSTQIKLIGGRTYWLFPLPANTTTYLVWNLDTTNLSGNGAVSKDYGKIWTAAPLSPFGAFDIYGTTSK